MIDGPLKVDDTQLEIGEDGKDDDKMDVCYDAMRQKVNGRTE